MSRYIARVVGRYREFLFKCFRKPEQTMQGRGPVPFYPPHSREDRGVRFYLFIYLCADQSLKSLCGGGVPSSHPSLHVGCRFSFFLSGSFVVKFFLGSGF